MDTNTCQSQKGCFNDSSLEVERHPCYSKNAQHHFARMHLPVAPGCNISCNYCNRKFDCVNESRPGVASEILTPEQGLMKFREVREKIPELSVVGIAGPGDALANWEAAHKSLSLIQKEAPDILFCLSTNGLLLPEYGEEMMRLNIRHVTVTVNCISPEIGTQIYRYIHYQEKCYLGENAVEILLANQMAGISLLAGQGVLVKVNIVMMKGINDAHIPEVVREVKRRGACMTNIMPFIPVGGSAFQYREATERKELDFMRDICEKEIPQMRHCRQCRADAVGLLGRDQSQKIYCHSKKEAINNAKCNVS